MKKEAPTTIPVFPELQFEERKHKYLLNGIEIPSMTTIMEPLKDKVYGTVDPELIAAAARKGTVVHNAIENYLKYDFVDCPKEQEGYLDAFHEWLMKYEPTVEAVEARVYHKILRYAGTCDLICQINGARTLVDYKTSYTVQPMLHSVQLEGYARAWDSHGVQIDDRIILHLKKDGKYSVYHYPASAEHYSVVSALMTLHSYQLKY